MSLTERLRLSRAVTILSVAALRLCAAAPAWANMMDPELYPEAAERYRRSLAFMYAGIIGCFALLVILSIAGAVLLIRWLARRNRANDALAAAGGPAPEPAQQWTEDVPSAEKTDDSPTDSAWD